MESRLSGQDVAFDLSSDDDDDDRSFSPAAYLQDARMDPAQLLEASDWESHKVDALQGALEKLDERSRDIVAARWLTEDKTTLQTLADRYQVSAERIRQLENNAMKKLKAVLAT